MPPTELVANPVGPHSAPCGLSVPAGSSALPRAARRPRGATRHVAAAANRRLCASQSQCDGLVTSPLRTFLPGCPDMASMFEGFPPAAEAHPCWAAFSLDLATRQLLSNSLAPSFHKVYRADKHVTGSFAPTSDYQVLP